MLLFKIFIPISSFPFPIPFPFPISISSFLFLHFHFLRSWFCHYPTPQSFYCKQLRCLGTRLPSPSVVSSQLSTLPRKYFLLDDMSCHNWSLRPSVAMAILNTVSSPPSFSLAQAIHVHVHVPIGASYMYMYVPLNCNLMILIVRPLYCSTSAISASACS